MQRHGAQHSIQGDIFQASKSKFLLSSNVGAHARFVLKALGLGRVLTTQIKCQLQKCLSSQIICKITVAVTYYHLTPHEGMYADH